MPVAGCLQTAFCGICLCLTPSQPIRLQQVAMYSQYNDAEARLCRCLIRVITSMQDC